MESHTNQVIVLSGGEPIANNSSFSLPDDAYVIAADSGLHHAKELGLAADLVIGDMDSVDAAVLDDAVRNGSSLQRHPTAKDSTDLELAFEAALAMGAERILVVGSHTGRLDHLLGSMGLVAATARHVDEIVWTDGHTIVTVCTPRNAAVIDGRPGDRLSLVPTGADVVGVTTEGLRWSLDAETLAAGSTRGVSNVMDAALASIQVEEGTLFIVHERANR
ncbi:MAG: thiamine diphosphokinase [Acidimicrobiia bacterium]